MFHLNCRLCVASGWSLGQSASESPHVHARLKTAAAAAAAAVALALAIYCLVHGLLS